MVSWLLHFYDNRNTFSLSIGKPNFSDFFEGKLL